MFSPKVLIILILYPNHSFGFEWQNDENCGQAAINRIVGGSLAAEGKYPWLARLGFKTKIEGRYRFLCGGSLINKLFVVTAAHCLEDGYDQLKVVRLGETKIVCTKSNCKDPKVQQILIEQIFKNPKFDTKTGFADIAILKLSHPAYYTDWVRPICLTDRKLAVIGKVGIAAGFGMENSTTKERPGALKELSMEIVPGTTCKSVFPNADFSSENYICGGGKKGEDTCNGDSGGPFMKIEKTEKGRRAYLVGIISFGSTQCGIGAPGIFTSISFQWDWIIQIVSK